MATDWCSRARGLCRGGGQLGNWEDRCEGAIVEKLMERLEYCGSGDSVPAVGKNASTDAGRRGVTGIVIP